MQASGTSKRTDTLGNTGANIWIPLVANSVEKAFSKTMHKNI
jgi:hypothetical protein